MRYLFNIWCIVCILTAGYAEAQEKSTVEMYPDQQVYITGERIWVAGMVPGGDGIVPVQVFLADRAGKVVDRLQLLSKDHRFQGNIQLNGELTSDYYVLACTYRSKIVVLTPVMIINPVKPPAGKKTNAVPGANEHINPIALASSKNVYQKAEQVEVNLGKMNRELPYMVTVARRDGLSDYADSVLGGWKAVASMATPLADNAEGHLLKTKVGAPGARIFAAVLGDQANLATAVTGADGRANILLPFMHTDLPLVLTAQLPDGQYQKVNYESELLLLNMDRVLPELMLDERFGEDLAQRIINAEVTNKFRPSDKFAYNITGLDTTDFYGEPDKRYILDNYTRFPDMQEILQEFIPEVRVRKTNGKSILQVLNAPFKTFFEQPALVLLDGVPVTDINQLLALDPLKLKSVDVVTRRFIMGDQQIPGIVQYKSYSADLAGYVLPADQTVYDFRGIQIPVQPQFEMLGSVKESRLPDMRNLIYWTPFRQWPEGAIKFLAPDIEGQYRLRVRGSDTVGTKYLGEMDIIVK